MEPESKTLRVALDGEAGTCLKRMCREIKSGGHPVKMASRNLMPGWWCIFLKTTSRRRRRTYAGSSSTSASGLKNPLKAQKTANLRECFGMPSRPSGPKRAKKRPQPCKNFTVEKIKRKANKLGGLPSIFGLLFRKIRDLEGVFKGGRSFGI